MSTPTAWPSGVSAPLTVENNNNHSALIVLITAFSFVLVVAALAARVFSSYKRHTVQRDDYLFGMAVILAFAQVSVVFTQVHYGWGTRTELTAADTDRMLRAAYAADILCIIALGLSKITTSMFYEVLFSQVRRLLIRAVLGGVIVWTLVAIILLAVRCSHDPWNDISAQCKGLLPRWQAITAMDIIIEILLFLYSTLAIYKVRISTKKKFLVLCALGCRIVLVPLAAIRLHYTQAQIESDDPVLQGAFATVATELYLAMSVVCLVSAFLKSFMAVYVDGNGLAYTESASVSVSKSRVQASADGITRKIRRRTSAGVNQLSGWELMEDASAKQSGFNQGWEITKTVQLDIQDEPIELANSKQPPRAVVAKT
ncbi:hypothetical protein IFM58399_06109 [Aspergillus lentulus]|uniref:Rhodopsin domain-containing protein n=1 Tax=Aspergillus lentulus TaxID=293939 RepID=A0ABQ1AL99_ASPLE|nr:uncharacterized protein IFM58399_06109 [Aspergillus lentulus]GFF40981.1 hypothetical protein IFM58399_06109 [Aspergillus lentulus]GFF83973.1 hypothetical protein IFM60648_06877 [Aspergillus lentulus]